MLKSSNKPLTPIQQKILELLRSAIFSEETLSMSDIAKELDFDSPNAVFYHIKTLERQGLIIRNSSGKVIRVNSLSDASGSISFLPLLGSARCGLPLEQLKDSITERMVPIPLKLLGQNMKKNLFLISAIGDSMSPKIENTDIVIFEPDISPIPGNVVVARTDEGAIIKRFKETKEQIILESDNLAYQPLVFEKLELDKTLNIDGVAVGVFKSQLNL